MKIKVISEKLAFYGEKGILTISYKKKSALD